MQNETDVVSAMAKAVEFETYNRGFDDIPEHQANVVIEQLNEAGFVVVRGVSIKNLHDTLRTVELGLKLERERVKLARELVTVFKLGSPPPLEGNAKAVRNLVTAHALIARAAGVLGYDACDEILNNLAEPEPGPVSAADQPITTVSDLFRCLAAATDTGDRDTVRRLVNLGASMAIDADLDIEFAYEGIYWDAPDEKEIARASAMQQRAKVDLAALLGDLDIKAAYERDLQGKHYQELRAERTRAPSLSDEAA